MCILKPMVAQLVTIEDTENKTPHILDQVANSEMGTLWFHHHADMKTPFSRWLAINRQRRAVRYRHTTKNIDRVAFEIADIATTAGLVAFDDGSPKNYLSFFRVGQDGTVVSLPFGKVETLQTGRYFLWYNPA